jgi:hypothetical protein
MWMISSAAETRDFEMCVIRNLTRFQQLTMNGLLKSFGCRQRGTDSPKFPYRILPLLWADPQEQATIFRRQNSITDDDGPDTHQKLFPPYPESSTDLQVLYDSLPVIESHANPFFVTANTGPKLFET